MLYGVVSYLLKYGLQNFKRFSSFIAMSRRNTAHGSSLNGKQTSVDVNYENEIKLPNMKDCPDEECRRMSKSKYRFQNIPKRYYITFMVFLSTVIEGYFITDMSIVIVDITSDRKIIHGNETEIIKAEYNWTQMERSLILSINSIGQVVACFGGVIVHKIGGATFLGVGKMGEAIVSLSSPFIMKFHLYLFAGHRFVLGFFEGLSFIGVVDVLAHWAPLSERVSLLTFAYLGYSIGTATNYPICGFIIQNFGWRAVFYTTGGFTLIWSITWFLSVSNDPSTDRFISEKERIFLTQEINYISKENKINVPYRSILTSIPVYALLNEIFISGFLTSFSRLLPLYVKDTYDDADIQTIGLISGVPEFSALIICPFLAHFVDYLRCKPNGYGIGKLHKVIIFWGQCFTLIFFFFAAVYNNFLICVTCLALARIAFGLSSISYHVIFIDFAGQYAGFVKSLTQLLKSVSHFINPLLIGLLIPNHSPSEWNVYFLVISFLSMYGVIVFVIFGSGDLQPWARIPAERTTENNENESRQAN